MRNLLSLIAAATITGLAAAQEAPVLAAEAATEAELLERVESDAVRIEEGPGEVGAGADTVGPDESLLVVDGSEVTLEEFLWVQRLVVVFADTPVDPRFREQLELLLSRPEELIARDVVVITDTDPAARSSVRLKLRPRGFQLALLEKDGKVNLRKPFPWDVREITRAIDKWPMRQQEIRARQGGN